MFPIHHPSIYSSIQIFSDGRPIFEESTLEEENFHKGGHLNVKISNLISINLSSYQLTSLGNFGVLDYAELKDLDLSKNMLTTIPESITLLQNLQNLNLSENQLVDLPVHMENLCSLKVLNLKNNPNFSHLPSTLASLKKLQKIFISSTNIKEITPDFLTFVKNDGEFDIGLNETEFPPLENPELALFVNHPASLDRNVEIRRCLTEYWTSTIQSHISTLLNTVAVALLGRTLAGKTTFARTLIAGVPTHAEESTVGFEPPVELQLNDPTEHSAKMYFNILDLAGQECYGILHTILLGAGNDIRGDNVIFYIVINASEYHKSTATGNELALHQTFIKYCGIWALSALSIDPFACLRLVISHTDMIGTQELVKVTESLQNGFRRLIDDRIMHLKCKPNLDSQISQLEKSKSYPTIQFACYKDKSPANEDKFLSGLTAAKSSLIEDFKRIEYKTSYPFEWHPVVNYLMGCAAKFSDALLSSNYMKQRFPDHVHVMDSILLFLDRRRIIYLFPNSEYFCPSTLHLQKLCRLAVNHTSSEVVMKEFPDVQLTGNVPVKFLEELLEDSGSKVGFKKPKTSRLHCTSAPYPRFFLPVLLLVLLVVIILAIILPSLILPPTTPPPTPPMTEINMTTVLSTDAATSATTVLITTGETATTTTPAISSTANATTAPTETPPPNVVTIAAIITATAVTATFATAIMAIKCISNKKNDTGIDLCQEPPSNTTLLDDDQISLKSLMPRIPADELFKLMKEILIKHFICCQVQVKSNPDGFQDCLHLPFLLRETVDQEECLEHWPVIPLPDNCMLLTEFYFPYFIPSGLLTTFLNLIRLKSGGYFHDHELESKCLWQGGAIITFSSVMSETFFILIQGVNYSMNLDTPEVCSPLNSGPYKIDANEEESKILVAIQGPKTCIKVMWKWMIYAKEKMHHLCMSHWPGCNLQVYLCCPSAKAIESNNPRKFDHGNEHNFEISTADSSSSHTNCLVCGIVEASMRHPPFSQQKLISINKDVVIPGGFYQGTLKVGLTSKRDVQVKLIMNMSDNQVLMMRLEELRCLNHNNILAPDHHDYDRKEDAYMVTFSHRVQSVREYVQSTPQLSDTEKMDLCKQILTGLSFLALKNIHGVDLFPDEIHLFKNHKESPNLRLSFDIERSTVTDQNTLSTMEKEDLKKACIGIYWIMTKLDKITFMMEDLQRIPQVALRILILALLKGLRAEDALKSPAFHDTGYKMEIINKLNDKVKAITAANRVKQSRGEPVDNAIFVDLEDNLELMMGDKNCWFHGVSSYLQTAYGLRATGYNIVAYADLLRFVRNIIAHPEEAQDAIEKTLRCTDITNEQIFEYFAKRFGYLYLRSFYVFQKFQHNNLFKDDLFLKESKLYEKAQIKFEEDMGRVKNLSKTNSIKLEIEGETNIRIILPKPDKLNEPRSIVKGEALLAAIEEETRSIWPTLSINCFSITDTGGNQIQSKSRVLEDSTIKVSRQVLIISLPQIPDEIEVQYQRTFTVKWVCGKACQRFHKIGNPVEMQNLKAFQDGIELSKDKRLESLPITSPFTLEVKHN